MVAIYGSHTWPLFITSVNKCNKLCTIVPAKLSRRLPNLKEVLVECCAEVKELFELDLVCTDMKENELLLSHLEWLWLYGLPELTGIWKGPTIGVLSLVNLRKLDVVWCPKLRSLLSLSHAPSLVQLQALKITCCNELIQIFLADELEIQSIGHEATVWFPQLKELVLEKLPNFIGFWHKNYIPPLPLMPSLESLCIAGCPKMGAQFIADLQVFEKNLRVLRVEGISLPKMSITDFEGLQPLISGLDKVEEDLTVKGCKGIEELLHVGVGHVGNALIGEHNNVSPLQATISWNRLVLNNVVDLACIWRGPSQILIFHNLSTWCVSECHGLKKHLLTTSIARSLLQLTHFYVGDCKELEQIVADDETGDHDKNTTVLTLPRLDSLYLIQLPNLISFCPSSCHFIFPSLCGSLSVDSCPNNSTGFFLQVQSYEENRAVVHAKGERTMQ